MPAAMSTASKGLFKLAICSPAVLFLYLRLPVADDIIPFVFFCAQTKFKLALTNNPWYLIHG